jgi:hypothetical protein
MTIVIIAIISSLTFQRANPPTTPMLMLRIDIPIQSADMRRGMNNSEMKIIWKSG